MEEIRTNVVFLSFLFRFQIDHLIFSISQMTQRVQKDTDKQGFVVGVRIGLFDALS